MYNLCNSLPSLVLFCFVFVCWFALVALFVCVFVCLVMFVKVTYFQYRKTGAIVKKAAREKQITLAKTTISVGDDKVQRLMHIASCPEHSVRL